MFALNSVIRLLYRTIKYDIVNVAIRSLIVVAKKRIKHISFHFYNFNGHKNIRLGKDCIMLAHVLSFTRTFKAVIQSL